jgi:hypothetical protein
MKSWMVLVAVPLLGSLSATPASPQWIQWARDGVPATSSTAGYFPDVVPDGSGGCIVVWCDYRFSGSSEVRAYVQRLTSDGLVAPGWRPDGVPLSATSGMQFFPLAIPDGNGGAIVAWQEYRSETSYNAFAQRITASGSAGEGWPADGVPLCTQPGYQVAVAIVDDGVGGVIVAWEDGRSGGRGDIYAQRLSAAGVPLWAQDGVCLSTGLGDKMSPVMVSDGSGGAIVAWPDTLPGACSIYAQRVDSSGNRLWGSGAVRVCMPSRYQQTNLRLVTDGTHGAIAAWVATGVWDCVLRQRVLANGTIAWPTDVVSVQDNCDLVADGAGGAIVVWQDVHQLLDDADIYAQRVDMNGNRLWAGAGVAVCSHAGLQQAPRLCSDAHGGAIVVWEDWRNSSSSTAYDNSDVYAQWLDASGAYRWTADGEEVCTAAGNQIFPLISADASSGFIVWLDRRGDQWGLYAQRVRTNLPENELAIVTSAEADLRSVRIAWRVPLGLRAEILKRTWGSAWTRIRESDPDSSRMILFDDRDVTPGQAYEYVLGFVQGQGRALAGQVRVTVPAAPPLGLQGLRPNPAIRDAFVAFSLPDASPARLELLDLAGREVLAREVGDLGVGNHVVNLSAGRALAPGIYLVRLTRGARSLTARAVVLR